MVGSGRELEWDVVLALVEAVEWLGEVLAGEAPVERLRDLVVAVLELVECAGEGGGVVEVVGVEQLALDDRVVDLDLVEPAGVDGQVDEDQVAPTALEPLDRALAAVVGAVVDDPEDASCRGVGLLAHDLADEPVERLDPALGFAAADHAAAAHVPGVEVADGTHPLVLVLDQLAAAGGGRSGL